MAVVAWGSCRVEGALARWTCWGTALEPSPLVPWPPHGRGVLLPRLLVAWSPQSHAHHRHRTAGSCSPAASWSHPGVPCGVVPALPTVGAGTRRQHRRPARCVAVAGCCLVGGANLALSPPQDPASRRRTLTLTLTSWTWAWPTVSCHYCYLAQWQASLVDPRDSASGSRRSCQRHHRPPQPPNAWHWHWHWKQLRGSHRRMPRHKARYMGTLARTRS